MDDFELEALEMDLDRDEVDMDFDLEPADIDSDFDYDPYAGHYEMHHEPDEFFDDAY